MNRDAEHIPCIRAIELCQVDEQFVFEFDLPVHAPCLASPDLSEATAAVFTIAKDQQHGFVRAFEILRVEALQCRQSNRRHLPPLPSP